MKNSITQARKAGIALAIAAFCVAYTSAPASAGAQEDQTACMNDALTVCSQFVPDRDRVASCLISNLQPQPYLAGVPHGVDAVQSEDGIDGEISRPSLTGFPPVPNRRLS